MICVAVCSRICAQLRCSLSDSGCCRQERSRYTAALDVVWTWYWLEPTLAPSRSLLAAHRLHLFLLSHTTVPHKITQCCRRHDNTAVCVPALFLSCFPPFHCWLFCLFVCLFVYSSIHTKKAKHSFTTEAQFEKDKTTVWIKRPTQGSATYV